ncbi:guanylate kinase [bacterium]|nr:guanylate kinase [candidate division CSSED10-310 bacterium]
MVISSPSGGGKSTLVRSMLAEFPDTIHSVSYTTRPPRRGEVDHREYHFISRGDFSNKIEAGDFAEWAEVHGNFYGTDKRQLVEYHEEGYDVLLDLDVQGAMQFKESLPESVLIFLLPPSRSELERRLVGRGSEDAEALRIRLRNAAREMKYIDAYDYLVVNDDLSDAQRNLAAILRAERLQRRAVASEELQRILMEVEGWT